MPTSRFLAAPIMAAVLLAPALAAHADFAAPEGPVLLTVTGVPDAATPDGMVQLDREALAAMAGDEFTTSTIWTDGPQTFTGVSLHDLMAALGIDDAEMIIATAVNDYSVEIPASDAQDSTGPIVALTQNGAPMSRRGNGPLWIVYPYDSDPEWQTEQTYSRSIWQLDRLEVVGDTQ